MRRMSCALMSSSPLLMNKKSLKCNVRSAGYIHKRYPGGCKRYFHGLNNTTNIKCTTQQRHGYYKKPHHPFTLPACTATHNQREVSHRGQQRPRPHHARISCQQAVPSPLHRCRCPKPHQGCSLPLSRKQVLH